MNKYFKILRWLTILLMLIPFVNAAEWDYTGISFSLASEDASPSEVFSDGSFYYMSGQNNARIYKYYLNWTYTGTSYDVSTQDLFPSGIFWDGTNWFMTGTQNANIDKYDSSWNHVSLEFSVTAQDNSPQAISKKGADWYVMGNTNTKVFKYNLAGTYSGTSFDVSTEGATDLGIFWDGTNWWMASLGASDVFKYDSNWNYLSINFDVGTEDTQPRGIYNDDDNWWMVGTQTSSVYKYEGVIKPIVIENITGNNQELVTINNFNSTSIDFFVNLTINSGTNADITYTLDSDSPVTLATNVTSTNNTIDIGSGEHSIFFTMTNNETSINSSSFRLNVNQTINFQETDLTPITNFTLGGIDYENFATLNTGTGGIVVGENTLLFERLGFASTNITFTINSNSEINKTFNITSSVIVLKIFDRETGSLITGTSTITLVASVGFNGTTSTGELNITNINFLSEDYKITVEHADYFTESVFFTYNNQETLNVNVYMLDTNSTDAGFITVEVFSDLQQFVDGAIVKALEWIPSTSSFETRAQGITNTNGQAILNIEIGTKTYKFSADDGINFKIVNEPNGNIVQVNADTIPIQFDAVGEAVGSITDGLFTNVVLTNISENVSIVSFAFSDSNGLVTEGCLNFYKVRGNIRLLLNQTCISSSTGEIIEQFFINNTFNLEVEALVVLSDQTRSIQTFPFPSINSISKSLAEYGFDVLVPLIMMLVGLGLGFVITNVYIAIIVMNGLLWLSILIVPNVITSGTVLFLSILGSLVMWGGFKK